MAVTGIGSSGSAAEFRPAPVQPRLVRFDRDLEAWRTARRGAAVAPDQPEADGAPAGRTATGEGRNQAANSTVFLAQYFGQAESSTEVASAFRAGAAAYRAAADRTRRPDQPPAEVLPPETSSGHSLDLTI